MKKLLLFASALCFSLAASAQYYEVFVDGAAINPKLLNNEDEQPPAYLSGNYNGYTDVLTSGQSGWSASQSIPFAFEFNGGAVTSYSVAAAGVVSFASNIGSAPSETNISLPTSMIPDSSICAWGLNLSGANDGVVKKTFGTAPNRQHWIIWASVSSGDLGAGWSYWGIVLEETTNMVYVVDMRSFSQTSGNVGLTVGVQIDSNNATEAAASPNVMSGNTATGGNDFLADDNSWYVFGHGTQPTDDGWNLNNTNDDYHVVNTALDIEGRLANTGSATITSLEMSYTINGGTPVVDNITGLNIAMGDIYDYSLPTSWTPVQNGDYEVEVEITMVNGNIDGDDSQNMVETMITVGPTPLPRTPLVESFTSSTCGPCVQGNINVGNILAGFVGQYSKVNYQMSWPGSGDPYYTDEAGVRRTYHGVNSVPAVFTDGTPNGNSQNYTAAMFNAEKNNGAFVDLTIEKAELVEHTTYEMDKGELEVVSVEREVMVDADMTPIIDVPSGQVAHIAIIENQTEENVGTNGETEFDFVMKKMIPGGNGQPLAALPANQTYTHSGSWEIQGEYRLPNNAGDPINHNNEHSIEEFNDLSAVVWLEDQGAGQVWQSANASIDVVATDNIVDTTIAGQSGIVLDGQVYIDNGGGSYEALGVENKQFVENISVFPNPAKDFLTIKGLNGNINVTIMDAMGRMVSNSTVTDRTINVSDLAPGVYNVVLDRGDVRSVEKVTIVK